MAKIIIFGSGEIAQIANYYFEKDSDYEVVAFTVDKDTVLSIIACVSGSVLKRMVAGVCASSVSLVGSIGAFPPFGVATVIVAPLSIRA